MKDFFEELKSADSIGEVLLEHRAETVKIAAVAVLVLTALLLFVYRGNGELELTDAAETLPQQSAAQETDAAEAGTGESGAGTDRTAGGQTGNGSTGNAGAAGASDTAAADAGAAGTVAAADAGAGYAGGASSGQIYVDIGGAVKEPKLAVLPGGSRVEDAILQAGGTTEEADLTTINRAAVLSDGDKIYIPKKGEAVPQTASGGSTQNAAAGSGTGAQGSTSQETGAGSSGRININTADLTQLQQITGVGPVTAQKIIDYRNANGNFSAIEDLKNVSGIGEKTFEKMKGDITI